jgi:hypothetical protein
LWDWDRFEYLSFRLLKCRKLLDNFTL